MKFAIQRAKVVSLAGWPATGKTTLCRELVATLAGSQYFSPKLQISEWRDHSLDEFLEIQLKNLKIWFLGVSSLSESDLSVVVCDRGAHDIMCFTSYIAIHAYNVSVEVLNRFMQEFYAVIDIEISCFYLFLEEEERVRRIVNRKKLCRGRGLKNPSNYWNYYDQWYRQCLDVELYDVTGLSLSEVRQKFKTKVIV